MNPKFILSFLFMILGLAAHAEPVAGLEVADIPDESQDWAENDDGIIRPDDLVSSLVLQTHGNKASDASTDILSSYFLRDYLTAQAEGFKYLGSEEEFFFPWALPLSSHRKVVDTEKVLSRYNLVRRQVPQFRYKYDYVTKTVYVREGATSRGSESTASYGSERRSSAGKLVKRRVRTREVVGVRQVGFRTCRVKCPHPEGKYEEELLRPIIKTEGIAVLPRGWHAANAQMAFSTIKTGLPAEDPQVTLVTRSFNNILSAYGIPDYTADVAWLTALYANLPQENNEVKEWTSKLTSRLVAGASQAGSHSGMWGPVCINREYVGKIVDHDADFVKKELAPLRTEILRQLNERRKQRMELELAEQEALYEDWQRVYLVWAMAGNAVHHPRKKTVIPADTHFQNDLVFSYSLHVPGLVHNPYQFQFTDIESTTLALFALNEVHAAGLLPEQTLVPMSIKKRPLSKPVNVSDVMAACYNTLRRLRLGDGGWNSCYSVSTHRSSRDMPYTSILPKNFYETIQPEEHWSYRIMGLASMEYLAKIIGGKTGERIHTETSDSNTGLIKWMLENLDDIDFSKTAGQGDSRYFLADIIASRNPESQLLWRMVGAKGIEELENLADMEVTNTHDTHSARAAIEAERMHFEKNPDTLRDWSEETDEVSSFLMSGIPSLKTRAAVAYFLASGIRQPVFAYANPVSPHGQCPALVHLMNANEEATSLNYFKVRSVDDIQFYANAFFLVIEGTDGLVIGEEGKTTLGEYLADGGTLVCLGPSGQSPQAMQDLALSLMNASGMEFSVSESDGRGGRCIEYHLDGRLALIVVDSTPDAEPRLTYSNRLKIYRSLMLEKLPADFLSESYSLLPGRTTNAELTLTGVEWEKGWVGD